MDDAPGAGARSPDSGSKSNTPEGNPELRCGSRNPSDGIRSHLGPSVLSVIDLVPAVALGCVCCHGKRVAPGFAPRDRESVADSPVRLPSPESPETACLSTGEPPLSADATQRPSSITPSGSKSPTGGHGRICSLRRSWEQNRPVGCIASKQCLIRLFVHVATARGTICLLPYVCGSSASRAFPES